MMILESPRTLRASAIQCSQITAVKTIHSARGILSMETTEVMMEKSLVYNLYMDGKSPTAKAHPKLFKRAWTSARDQMRFFKVLNVSEESKEWVADPKNLLCDAPG